MSTALFEGFSQKENNVRISGSGKIMLRAAFRQTRRSHSYAFAVFRRRY
jgi:hypothetical protein